MAPLANPLSSTPSDSVSVQPDAVPDADSFFERLDWIYILCRERLFRNDLRRITASLWGNARPIAGTRLVELGCGPGFYSRNLARHYPELEVVGIDCASSQLDYARTQVQRCNLGNCRYEHGDVLGVTRPAETFNYLLASRLFTILPDPARAVAKMYRVLSPGGRCFIAEPRYRLWASVPLVAMWLVASCGGYRRECREPARATVFTTRDFEELLRTQPWREVRVWQEGRYHYALCEKG